MGNLFRDNSNGASEVREKKEKKDSLRYLLTLHSPGPMTVGRMVEDGDVLHLILSLPDGYKFYGLSTRFYRF